MWFQRYKAEETRSQTSAQKPGFVDKHFTTNRVECVNSMLIVHENLHYLELTEETWLRMNPREKESYMERVLSSDVSHTKPVEVLHHAIVTREPKIKALIKTMVSYFWQI